MTALVSGVAWTACEGFGIAGNTGTTFDVFFWIEVANFDVPLVQSAPNGPDYIDVVIFVLRVHSSLPRKASNPDASQVCLRQARCMWAWLCGIYLHFCIADRHVVPCNHESAEPPSLS